MHIAPSTRSGGSSRRSSSPVSRGSCAISASRKTSHMMRSWQRSRAGPAPRSESRALGQTAHSPRRLGPRTCGKARRPARPLCDPGVDCGVSCTSPDTRRDGLGPHRSAVRAAGDAHAVTRRGAESCRCCCDGVRSSSGPRARRCAESGACTSAVPSPAERAGRSPQEGRPT